MATIHPAIVVVDIVDIEQIRLAASHLKCIKTLQRVGIVRILPGEGFLPSTVWEIY